MESVFRDFRYSLRTLRKSPGFTAVVLLTLVLGIGANSAIFSVVNAVLLRPLPYPDADRIVRIWGHYDNLDLPPMNASPGELLDYRERGKSYAALGGFISFPVNITGGDEPERIQISYTTNGFFETLGVEALLGRVFGAEENRPGGPAVAVLSHGLWQRRFGADPELIGQTIYLNERPQTVLGVMPAGFAFPQGTDLWLPIQLDPAHLAPRGQRYLKVIARLQADAGVERARQEMSAIARQFGEEHAGLYPADSGWTVRVVPLLEEVVGDVRVPLLVLFATVGLVLLIACSNVIHLLLARAQARARETAMRVALGARRGHLVRQYLVEVLLLALVGGALGLLLADRGLAAFLAVNAEVLPRAEEIGLDGRVFGFTLALSLLTGLALAVIPALRASRPDLQAILKEGGKATPGRQHFRHALVAVEVALALTLLISAGLMIKSFARLQAVDPGFRGEKLLTFQLSLARAKYGDGAQAARFFDQLIGRLEGLPGVEAASGVSLAPLAGVDHQSGSVGVEGQDFTPGTPLPEPEWRGVDHRFFRTMGIPLVAGRGFELTDDDQATPVAVIDEALARKLWPGEEAVGKRLIRGAPVDRNPNPWLTVVGVAKTVKQFSLSGDEDRGVLYAPQLQWPNWSQYLVLRTATENPLSMADMVRAEIRSIDPNQPIDDVKTMAQRISETVATPRFSMQILMVFAGLAVVLAAVGIYGVVAYSVSQRTQEIGIRRALGANPLGIFRMVITQGMAVVLSGIAAGLLLAFWAARAMRSLLFEVTAADPVVFLGVPLLMAAVAVVAHLVPARRAAKLEPTNALRYE